VDRCEADHGDRRVENGRIAYPVEEVTIAGNLADMFARISRSAPTC
jgi:predicted Zn-dependent protease